MKKWKFRNNNIKTMRCCTECLPTLQGQIIRICPTKIYAQHRGHNRLNGFTLVELVITIAIVIILSVISVPIYRGYVDKAKWSEAYAALGTILSAQKAYYSEYGNFSITGIWSDYDPNLGVDVRGNKYFTLFANNWTTEPKIEFRANFKKPIDLGYAYNQYFGIYYNITKGSSIFESY